MKPRRMLSFLLVFIVSAMLLLPSVALAKAKKPTLLIDNNVVGMSTQEKRAYRKLKAQVRKRATHEGAKWGNDKFYMLDGRIYTYNGMNIGGGYGCHGFALKMSDLAFGKSARFTVHRKWSKIRVGDLIRVNDGKRSQHSVVVMKVVGKRYALAEGNYGGRVHWGRVITRSEVKRTGSYVVTRY